ncbi:CoA transferase subunit A [Ferviditalea candida]|uniref:CoA transferase subunit A n=1 Tax=Ferviditalea candida TaxID=3108399 RepID=A0ABU5ZME7_9BACL|nr:CoA transferase subunit A [Paenibacillaceae bacterium T2]
MKNKIISKEKAISRIREGMTLMVGGFGLVGSPLELIDELRMQGTGGLTVISNNLGEPGKGLDLVLQNGQIKKAIGSYFTSNPNVGIRFAAGELAIELLPQGTFSEAIRGGGAGIGGFYTRSAAGTLLADGKETRTIDGETYVFEKTLHADVALIRAYRADTLGNLIYRKTARNFNPVMATAADLVIVEVEEIVEPGQLDPESIVTPHLYVDYLVRRGRSHD